MVAVINAPAAGSTGNQTLAGFKAAAVAVPSASFPASVTGKPPLVLRSPKPYNTKLISLKAVPSLPRPVLHPKAPPLHLQAPTEHQELRQPAVRHPHRQALQE